MTTLLMCKPEYFDIRYEINPWMSVKRGAHPALALAQWTTLCETIERCGARIALVPPVANLPDLTFTANAALRCGKAFYLSRFQYPERQPEHSIFKQWFMQQGFTLIPEPDDFFDAQNHYIGPCFEGAGDALFAGDTLFAAYGFRTDKTIYSFLRAHLKIKKHVPCELVDPHFYHLDTCFCPLNDHQAIWYPPAFSEDTQKRMKAAIELFAIPAEEEHSFACNAVVIGNNIIIPTGCPRTREILEELHFTVHECAMTEFIKSGGACKCLTLDLG